MRIMGSRGGPQSFARPWLTKRKRLGKICRHGQIRRPGRRGSDPQIQYLSNIINSLGWETGWHAVRMVNAGSPSWEWRGSGPNLSGEQRMSSVYPARVFAMVCAVLLAWAVSAVPAAATSRIKDLANIEGVRQNQLVGYGLVVGLNGTGDTLNNIPFTKQSLQAMLERMGVNIRGATTRTGNVAAVMVTGNLPPFGTQGTRMDVTVSSLGDAKNLQGGTLLVTPLLGADGNVYAVAQGSVAINGFQAEGEAAKVVRGVPTVGRIVNGAIIEREIEFALNRLPNVRLALRNADFTTAKRIASAVNDYLGAKSAEPIDPSTVQLSIPPE